MELIQMVQRIFEDFDDESHHYYVAKDISEHIEIAIDEIEALDGSFDIIGTDVWFRARTVEIHTNFRNLDNDTVYSWTFTNKYKLPFVDSIPKVLFFWINKFQVIMDELGHCVSFEFGDI